ncbi:MAG TPA: MFS transporter, partial [Verrucomicrobiae bacterium]|nr:MFS transporter [Verrucomicrobiae bacterium]
MTRTGYIELAALSGVQMMAIAIWTVPLMRILNAHGYATLAPYAYATSAVAAFTSPLLFGAVADRHVAPAVVMRWLALASAACTALASLAIQEGWKPIFVLGLIQLYSFFAAPTLSIANTIIFSKLRSSHRQFGPIRAVGTIGWIIGCLLISALRQDASASAGYTGAVVWLVLASLAFQHAATPPSFAPPGNLARRLGWDAFSLLKHHDHRTVFITAALFSIPLAAFYPYSPIHLQDLGFHRTAALMSLGQVTEVLSMLSLSFFFHRIRLKWIFAVGLAFGALRYTFSALNTPAWLLAGISLHGFTFAFFFITSQIYLNERVDAAWRARAQALLSLMISGVGNLAGYLSVGFWWRACSPSGATHWPKFWSW